jgi:hypothetical protein
MKDKYCSLVRATLPVLSVTAAVAFAASVSAQGLPGSIWYSGDDSGDTFLSNEYNTIVSDAETIYNFVVPAGQTWNVTSLYSNDAETAPLVLSGANWVIRTGVSNGNPGTTIASGTSDAAHTNNILNGQGGFGLQDYFVQVTGLNFNLTGGASGTEYYLNVSPIGAVSGSGRSFNVPTSFFNHVGPGSVGNDSWFNSNFFGANFIPASTQVGSPADFSDGVIGTVVPEPATVTLVTCGVGALLITVRFRRRRRKQ